MPKITILLSTYNGEEYLKEQLDSLFIQTYKNIEIIVRDDGSSDKTLEMLKFYDIKLLSSNGNIGIKKSFETLLRYACENSDAEYFMFCDQDDVWNQDKIEKTLEKMKELENLYGNNIPLLVHTDLEVVDENLKTISSSMWKSQHINPKSNSLNKLLIQNIITGCTTMINRTTVLKSLPISLNAIMHDWWIGLFVASFGKIGFLEEATIKYRQHGKNDTGSKKFNLKYILRNFNSKDTDKYIVQSKSFLESYKEELDEKSRIMLEDFSSIKEKPYLQRVSIILKYKLFKYGIIRNIGLLLKI